MTSHTLVNTLGSGLVSEMREEVGSLVKNLVALSGNIRNEPTLTYFGINLDNLVGRDLHLLSFYCYTRFIR